MGPLVSFVIPCYKFAHLLPQCINSILEQTYEDFEILIMDNCSPDNTPEVARSFNDPRVKHIRNEVNMGHVRNFNKGITLSLGKYVWLIAADDWLRSTDILGRYVDLMERNSGVGYVFCRAIEVHGSKEVGLLRLANCGDEDQIWNGYSFLRRLIRSNCVVMSSAMVRKECYDKVGLFSLDMPYACDWYLWCILALHYQVAYLSEPMVFFRVHEESLTTAFGNLACIVDELNALWCVASQMELAGVLSVRAACNASIAARAAEVLRSGPAENRRPSLGKDDFETMLRRNAKDSKDEEDIRARVHMALGDALYWDGEYDNARRSYWLGIRLRPWWLKSWSKYLLLQMGSVGMCIRGLLFQLRQLKSRAA